MGKEVGVYGKNPLAMKTFREFSKTSDTKKTFSLYTASSLRLTREACQRLINANRFENPLFMICLFKNVFVKIF